MADTVYRFGRCELDTAARELRVDGRSRPIEPRPFDVLVLLLRNRNRDVPTDELLDRLWRDEAVAPGSVVSAIAKVRRHIEDDGRLIRTVHRVGYRFAADVVEVVPDSSASAEGPAAIPIALMPFENLTGTPSLDWVSLGLLSLVCQALAEDDRISPLPVSTVVGALRRLDAHQRHDAAHRARAVQQITGVRHVVHTRLRRRDDGYVLECKLTLPVGAVATVLRASHPARLGRVLAHWLVAQLSPAGTSDHQDDVPVDPWALEVLAHALDASARREWERAQTMLAVVLDIEPDHPIALLEQLTVGARLRESEGRFGAAFERWRDAAERARSGGQQAIAEHVNGRAAVAAAMCGRPDEALALAEARLAHAQARGAPVELWRAVTLWCMVHAMVGRPCQVESLLSSRCDDAATDEARAAWWEARAHCLACSADPDAAAQAFDSATSLYRAIGAAGRESALMLPWLDALQRAGRFAEALPLLQRVEAISERNGMALRWLPWFRARQREGSGDREAALGALDELLDGSVQDLAHAAAVAQAARWLAEGARPQDAQAMLTRAGPGFGSHPLLRAAAARVDRLAR